MDLLITLFFLPGLLVWKLINNSPSKKLPPIHGGSILVIAVGGIGDTLLSLPALKSLNKNLPGLRITAWISDPKIRVFFQEKGMVDSFICYPFDRFFRPFHFFFENVKTLLELRRRKFSHVLVAEPSQNIISAVAGLLTGAKIRIGPRYRLGKIDDTDFLLTHSLPFSYEKHVLEMNLDLLEFLGIQKSDFDLYLPLSEKEKAIAESLLKANGLLGNHLLIGMHVGANPNQLYKCWEIEKFAEISDFLSQEYKARVLVTGGEGEKLQAEKMVSLTQYKPINLVGCLGLLETATLLSRCDLFITNDSGPMHIAASVKTPVVAIFGPTRPKKNAPYGRHMIIRKDLNCSPCYDWKYSRIENCNHFRCLREISVNEVKAAVKTMLGKNR